MDQTTIEEQAAALIEQAGEMLAQVEQLAISTQLISAQAASGGATNDPFLGLFTIFVLACFVGYFVVWSVTPALHSPLMGVTNAISSVIIVGGLLAAGPVGDLDFAQIMGFCAVLLASVNIFGGFIVTHRMLSMFKKKK
jgi:NAD(P) transhydrogenase subunit alpha